MHGLGKKRSKYGRYLDSNGIDQGEICKETGLNKDTVSKACNEDDPKLRGITKEDLAEAARKLSGKNVDKGDFW
ncbi:MAG: transcriptional regulator [Candidatus Cohnella colombiensis]|uniref:Transcriptional regulator n=1 Tax=Candidatus Cohnella colombiensis TaxID=3121368 RepID=A0AA95EUT4_9BACL|nr:MAG: transcriptional regulator [Cohnella sp.]